MGALPGENPIIINLPSTVEMTTPNVYADQIEWMNTHFKNRDSIILSIHPPTTTAARAWLPRSWRCLRARTGWRAPLFGNGERTGNVDILTVAYNMFSQGINPELNIENIREIAEIYERCTKMDIPPRHPYAGKLVFTAFSGSHQDAINKGMQALHERGGEFWEVPYLPIDPSDIGREYEPIVRINSQSGKGGVAFVMDTFYGFKLPKGMHKEFADVIQKISEKQGEVAPEQIMEAFKNEYLERKEPMHFRKCRITDTETGDGEFATLAKVVYTDHGIEKTFEGVGNGPHRCDPERHGGCPWNPDQGDGLQRARPGRRFRSPGCILYPPDRPGVRQDDLRRWHQLQHYEGVHPRYFQRGEPVVLLILKENRGTAA